MCRSYRWHRIVLIIVLALQLLLLSPTTSHSFTSKYDIYFYKYSKLYFGPTFDYKWFKAQSITESNLKPNATSPVGAKGLMQIMPGTWSDIQKKLKSTGLGIVANITDPEYNIMYGVHYDRYLWNNWKSKRPVKDRLSLMFASYNAGIGNILRAQKLCIDDDSSRGCNQWNVIKGYKHNRWRWEETHNYVDRIFMNYNKLKDK